MLAGERRIHARDAHAVLRRGTPRRPPPIPAPCPPAGCVRASARSPEKYAAMSAMSWSVRDEACECIVRCERSPRAICLQGHDDVLGVLAFELRHAVVRDRRSCSPARRGSRGRCRRWPCRDGIAGAAQAGARRARGGFGEAPRQAEASSWAITGLASVHTNRNQHAATHPRPHLPLSATCQNGPESYGVAPAAIARLTRSPAASRHDTLSPHDRPDSASHPRRSARRRAHHRRHRARHPGAHRRAARRRRAPPRTGCWSAC